MSYPRRKCGLCKQCTTVPTFNFKDYDLVVVLVQQGADDPATGKPVYSTRLWEKINGTVDGGNTVADRVCSTAGCTARCTTSKSLCRACHTETTDTNVVPSECGTMFSLQGYNLGKLGIQKIPLDQPDARTQGYEPIAPQMAMCWTRNRNFKRDQKRNRSSTPHVPLPMTYDGQQLTKKQLAMRYDGSGKPGENPLAADFSMDKLDTLDNNNASHAVTSGEDVVTDALFLRSGPEWANTYIHSSPFHTGCTRNTSRRHPLAFVEGEGGKPQVQITYNCNNGQHLSLNYRSMRGLKGRSDPVFTITIAVERKRGTGMAYQAAVDEAIAVINSPAWTRTTFDPNVDRRTTRQLSKRKNLNETIDEENRRIAANAARRARYHAKKTTTKTDSGVPVTKDTKTRRTKPKKSKKLPPQSDMMQTPTHPTADAALKAAVAHINNQKRKMAASSMAEASSPKSPRSESDEVLQSGSVDQIKMLMGNSRDKCPLQAFGTNLGSVFGEPVDGEMRSLTLAPTALGSMGFQMSTHALGSTSDFIGGLGDDVFSLFGV